MMAFSNSKAFWRVRRMLVWTCLPKKGVLNLCANNYLGLVDHQEVIGPGHGVRRGKRS